MKSYYDILDGSLVESKAGVAPIMVCAEPDEQEKQELMQSLGLNKHDLDSALDPDEISRVDFAPAHTYIIWKRPDNVSFEQRLKFNVSSAAFHIKAGRLTVILGQGATAFASPEFAHLSSIHDFMLKFFMNTVHHFLGHLKASKMVTAEIQEKLSHSQENKYLLQMISLGESFTYYLDALESNTAVLAKLQGASGKMPFTKAELDLLDDVMIENQQCKRQTEVYSTVLSGLMDARSSVINNNVNVLLKKLTLINVVFLPLNLIAGIGGMSEFSMMTQRLGWPLAYSLLLTAMACTGWTLWWLLSGKQKGN
jgi:magnesium transporter